MSQIIKSLASGPVPPSVATQYTTDSGIAVPALNNLNVFGNGGVTTSGSGSTITITIINDGFPWSEEALSFAAAVQHGYFCTAALTATLPASGGLVLGNTIIIVVDTASTVTIQAGVGESIQVSSTISAAGGTASSNTRGSVLELVFRPSDLTWHTISSLGVWTVT
jgi:hypothetical protein